MGNDSPHLPSHSALMARHQKCTPTISILTPPLSSAPPHPTVIIRQGTRETQAHFQSYVRLNANAWNENACGCTGGRPSLARHSRVKSVSTSLMWVGEAELVAGKIKKTKTKTKQTRLDLAEMCNHGDSGERPRGRRPPPPRWEGADRETLRRRHPSWVAGFTSDPRPRAAAAAAEPDAFSQPV